ncbi:MAG: hypothetical protein QM635_08265 [Microbacteriaceae bacterium]
MNARATGGEAGFTLVGSLVLISSRTEATVRDDTAAASAGQVAARSISRATRQSDWLSVSEGGRMLSVRTVGSDSGLSRLVARHRRRALPAQRRRRGGVGASTGDTARLEASYDYTPGSREIDGTGPVVYADGVTGLEKLTVPDGSSATDGAATAPTSSSRAATTAAPAAPHPRSPSSATL